MGLYRRSDGFLGGKTHRAAKLVNPDDSPTRPVGRKQSGIVRSRYRDRFVRFAGARRGHEADQASSGWITFGGSRVICQIDWQRWSCPSETGVGRGEPVPWRDTKCRPNGCVKDGIEMSWVATGYGGHGHDA